MPLPFLAASSKAALSAARQLAGTVGRTRPVVASLEDRISTWYSLGKSHRGTTWKGGRPGRPTTSPGQALSGDQQKAAYIQALASMGLSTETATRMNCDHGPPSKKTRGWRPTLPALQRERGLEKSPKEGGARVASPVYTAKVVDAASTKTAPPQQGSGTGVARPSVYTAPDAARASSGGGSSSWLRAVLSLKKPVCKATAYARYVESLASTGLSLEAAARIDRAVYRKGADMLTSYGGGSKNLKDRKPHHKDASSPLRGSKGADALKG